VPSNVYDTSVTQLLLVVVFQLGVCTLLLAEIAIAVRGYDTLPVSSGQLIGVALAAGALLTLFARRRNGIE
jgi:hypothetical protein